MASKLKAIGRAVAEGAIEAVKMIPFVGIPIESARKYRETMEEQQLKEFLETLQERVEDVNRNAEWYKTPEGKEFVDKIVMSSINAEYTDKIRFFANALANGPSLGQDQGKRLKFVEMIRQVSKPALEVLAVAAANPSTDTIVRSGELAGIMKWDPLLVDACVKELGALGVISNIKKWSPEGESFQKASWSSEGGLFLTELTKEFADLISSEPA